jgi:hypothetical protein
MQRFEGALGASGMAGLVLFLLVFSFVLAEPFRTLVMWAFALLTGIPA